MIRIIIAKSYKSRSHNNNYSNNIGDKYDRPESEIAPEIFSDPSSILLRLSQKNSIISIIQKIDQRKFPDKSLISDPSSGLLKLLKRINHLNNPKDESQKISGEISGL